MRHYVPRQTAKELVVLAAEKGPREFAPPRERRRATTAAQVSVGLTLAGAAEAAAAQAVEVPLEVAGEAEEGRLGGEAGAQPEDVRVEGGAGGEDEGRRQEGGGGRQRGRGTGEAGPQLRDVSICGCTRTFPPWFIKGIFPTAPLGQESSLKTQTYSTALSSSTASRRRRRSRKSGGDSTSSRARSRSRRCIYTGSPPSCSAKTGRSWTSPSTTPLAADSTRFCSTGGILVNNGFDIHSPIPFWCISEWYKSECCHT